jgi:signal transduction histidine kinase
MQNGMRRGDPEPPRRRWARWGAALAIWTVLGLADAVTSHFSYAARGSPISWGQAIGMGLCFWYAWVIPWWILDRLVRRLPLSPGNWRRPLALQLAVVVALTLAKPVLDYPAVKFFYCPAPEKLSFAAFYHMALVSYFYLYAVICCALLGAAHAVNTYGKYWERALHASRLEAGLARAQLQMLKAQLQPHFLFNTLNTISALIHTDVELADRTVARLGDLLRLSLDHLGDDDSSLRRELGFLQAYLEIEQVRFGPRLRVEIDVEPGVQGAVVPCLLLLPLVENAIRHGIGRKAGPGRVVVRARRAGRRLRLQVEDDGPGLPRYFREGIGLRNTRARLQQLHGDDHVVALRGGANGGVCVTVELPLRLGGLGDGGEEGLLVGAPGRGLRPRPNGDVGVPREGEVDGPDSHVDR